MSPKTKLVILATLIGLILISLFYFVGIQSRGFLAARIAVVVAIILYVLLTRIAKPKKQI